MPGIEHHQTLAAVDDVEAGDALEGEQVLGDVAGTRVVAVDRMVLELEVEFSAPGLLRQHQEVGMLFVRHGRGRYPREPGLPQSQDSRQPPANLRPLPSSQSPVQRPNRIATPGNSPPTVRLVKPVPRPKPIAAAPTGALVLLAAMPIAGLQEPVSGDERPTMAATRVEQGPTVDGDLSDAAWAQSEVGTDFMQHEPLDGVPATEQTELRVVFTDSTIYFGITAFDANPDAIIAKEMERDSRIFQDDSLLLLLDTFHDRRNAYAFETNLNGARTDTLVTDEGRDLNLEWDGIWSVASRRTAFGWAAEIAIPISTLRFDPQALAWGFNVQRYIAHKREMTHWSGLPREVSTLGQVGSQVQPVHRVSMGRRTDRADRDLAVGTASDQALRDRQPERRPAA